jgi:hypothetical protein
MHIVKFELSSKICILSISIEDLEQKATAFLTCSISRLKQKLACAFSVTNC